jgi:ribonuclease-3
MSSASDEEEYTLIDPPPLLKSEIDHLVGIKVNDLSLYQKAFTHKSAMKKYTLTESFETLEFIGDSVLGFVITKYLFDTYKGQDEGFLTKARTKLVRGETLAKIATYIHLDKWILMDDKGMRNGWHRNPKVLEDVFEALVGAIYMDIGLVHAKRFILDIFTNPQIIDMNCLMIDDNHKDRLMRHCQANKWELPQYPIDSHNNGVFVVTALINGAMMGNGSARNKKQAEQEAAQETLKQLGI